MNEVVCNYCAGTGEVMSLSNPSDPEDGSYTHEMCGGCGGSGICDSDAPVRPKVRTPKEKKSHKDSGAYKLALEACAKIMLGATDENN